MIKIKGRLGKFVDSITIFKADFQISSAKSDIYSQSSIHKHHRNVSQNWDCFGELLEVFDQAFRNEIDQHRIEKNVISSLTKKFKSTNDAHE